MVPLLVGTDGSQKMSKSLGNYIGVAQPPEDIYGKAMSINDSLIMNYFELLTDVPNEKLAEFRRNLEDKNFNPMALKKRIAREIITQLYDQKVAAEAEEYFKRVVQRKEVPKEIPEALSGELLQMIFEKGLAKSKGEAKRLIVQGAVDVDGKKVTVADANKIVPKGSIIKVGKRGYIKST
jgi:tyrosyl-tRNA synthetase